MWNSLEFPRMNVVPAMLMIGHGRVVSCPLGIGGGVAMATIHESVRHYEDWLREQLHGDIVEDDLTEKHEKMKANAFVFLRATYWRWAETILDICPDLTTGPQVLGVGDIHLENYGTWRDADGRLVWGVNDFDEAAEMPYALDLARLATSAILAGGSSAKADDIAAAIIKGYSRGLDAPRPVVLDRDYAWLRELAVVPEKERKKFWKKMDELKREPAPKDYLAAISRCMPEPGLTIDKTARRSAGAGSLGRPRWVGIADWRGGPIVREAKALVTSAWSRQHRPGESSVQGAEIANGKHRPIDPWYRIEGNLVVRRLSPNNRKIEAEDNLSALLSSDMLEAMGLDLANLHSGSEGRAAAIKEDLGKRKPGWLGANAAAAAAATEKEYEEWVKR
jgi:hypothetical protein